MKILWMIAMAVLVGMSASVRAADDAQLSETIRNEVARQLKLIQSGGDEAPPPASSVPGTADEANLARLVSAEIARQLYEMNVARAPSAEPADVPFTSRDSDQDWYYIPTGDEPFLSAEAALGTGAATRPRGSLAGASGAVTADNPVRPSNNAVEIITASSGTQATITLSTKEHEVGSSSGNRLAKASWNLVATAPIDKNTSEATFASLSGFANGFNIGGGWKFSSVPRTLGGDTSDWGRLFAVRASVGYDDFAYFTSLTNKETDRETRWSVGTSFGTSSPNRSMYFGGGVDIQRGYKGRPPRIVCPSSSSETFDCVQGAFGPPSAGYQRIAYVEARSQQNARPYSLRVAHDFESDRTSADMPIYLLRDKDSKFTGGLRFGWDSDNDFLAGIFVGKEFVIP